MSLTKCCKEKRMKQPGRQVKTKQGIIQGIRLVDDGNCQIDAFLGVPFAKPPIGSLRFKKPELPESWEGVKKTMHFGPRPPQYDFLWAKSWIKVKKSEDCLYLNIFSPTWLPTEDQKNGFAVMVFIHGGAFLIDSASRYGDINICNTLCRRNVIVVTIEYRLGLLGFFCTGDEACPGNIALWDQTMALQWIKENISAFYGDPDRITVVGQSAGGACADFLSLSPISRNLFQQVIAMSGNAECAWAHSETERIVDVCKKFAESVGWKKKGKGREYHEEMLDYLRTLPTKVFERRFFGSNWMDDSRIRIILSPVIDGDFLPKSIEELRKEAPIKNCIIGTCKYESLIFAAISLRSFSLRYMDKILNAYITPNEYVNYGKLHKKAKNYYLNNININDRLAVAHACEKLSSNLFLTNSTVEYVERMISLGHKVHLYSFDHFNPRSYGILSLIAPFKGSTHCTDLNYIFGLNIFPLSFKYTKSDEYVKNEVSKLWTNFAKFGNPNDINNMPTSENLKWSPVMDKSFCYLSIDTDIFQMKKGCNDFFREFNSCLSRIVKKVISGRIIEAQMTIYRREKWH
ncbi:Esterase CM06B1 [Dirofilaria immitis]